MKTTLFFALVAGASLLGSCAASVPSELADARQAYQRASSGAAAEIAPAELHIASLALDKAEASFKENEDNYQTRDLAYVAQRRAELASITASIAIEKERQSASKDDYQETQGKIIDKTKGELDQANTDLTNSEHSEELTAEQLAREKEARVAAELRASDAMEALAKLAAVKEEPRGMVITLSGSVLFASDKSTLTADAQTRLRAVADVLLASPERELTVEGHTDSQGSDSDNLDLSQNRADAVRNYLIQQGYDTGRVSAIGLGESQPVADNESTEGRANNRRVEIIIQREVTASK